MQKRNMCSEELALGSVSSPQKLLNSSYFFIQSICGAFFFSLAWSFIFSSAAVALRPISANGSAARLPSSSASWETLGVRGESSSQAAKAAPGRNPPVCCSRGC